ncbi:MAG: PadR family transcriptional regulator [Firmicutes bacterium]|jgi:DNA-binding PadR family transcriptional regulator|nr:PadR family transcriptional regulator [Bacillota bacterium]MBR4861134.1 PadR family transcriptional regulator [Bacillota bacterium]
MPREKFQTLTEQMFYILLCLRKECCGMDIMTEVSEITDGRVSVGPGTLYNLLEQFAQAGMIRETKVEGRKKSYILTQKGAVTLREEFERLRKQAADYVRLVNGED